MTSERVDPSRRATSASHEAPVVTDVAPLVTAASGRHAAPVAESTTTERDVAPPVTEVPPAGPRVSAPASPRGARTRVIPSERDRERWRVRRWPRLRWLCAAAGVLVPLVVLTIWTSHGAPSFDGAMNLQVAKNLADGAGYVRFYGGETPFPAEIETSGPFIFLAATILKIFGMSYFSLIATNLVFLAVLLVGISFALRKWPVAQLVAPSLVLLCAPDFAQFGAGGYGEFPIAAVLLWALILQASVISGASRPVLRMSAAFLLVGAAFTIKIVAAAAIPIALLGLVIALVVRRERSPWPILLTGLVAAVPVLLYEAFRLVEFGSLSAYGAYWRQQLSAVGQQAGVTAPPSGTRPNLFTKGLDHMHLLSTQTGVPAEGLVVLVATPGVLLLLAFLLRRTSWREWLALPGRGLAVLLAGYGYLYLVWWLFITPTEKAWLRRIIIALVILNLLFVLLLGLAVDRVRSLANESRRTQVMLALAAVVGLAMSGGTAWASVEPARRNWDPVVRSTTEWQDGINLAVEEAEALHEDGKLLYGGGWWSAPAVSLLMQEPFGDFFDLDPCSPADQALLATNDVVLVWDFYASRIVSAEPAQAGLEFTPVGDPTFYATFWQINFAPDACPTS